MPNIFEDLDRKKFGWFHLRSILTTGMGVFTDGYDLSSIGIVLAIVLSSYGITKITPGYTLYTSLIAGSALIGAAIGALIFGELAKRGRKKFYGVDVLILGIFAFLQIFAVNVYALIIIRLILGIGVGADYVMSPMIMGEHANSKDRGKTIAFGFGMMWGFGALLAAFAYMIFGPILGLPDAVVWRIVLAFGAVPALAVVYLRRKMPETPRFLARIAGDKASFEEEVKYVANREIMIEGNIRDDHGFGYYFKRYRREFIAAMLLWFLYDQIAYAGILFGPMLIASKLGLGPVSWTYLMEVFTLIGGIIMLSLIDRKGRKVLQILGFIGMGASLLLFDALKSAGIVAATTGGGNARVRHRNGVLQSARARIGDCVWHVRCGACPNKDKIANTVLHRGIRKDRRIDCVICLSGCIRSTRRISGILLSLGTGNNCCGHHACVHS
ncbi:inorganic phosphate transport protein related protein [Thermoplasma acidophilum]|uniref:Inorganic phosphate transport protein related protein n=1 Tax=Thermoplasma acidophilum (strain ATCC 25905 / DSM 1728 / JCM 9062 / NBRC 15155 / AMRC-C165) TaxID=273075 RepID=Q9HK26_THEAC|nr:MFS transporter [Thermoplasma acidophilum]CAC11913.1 inorganic phosphate transport protein related protein [Thermoplasma acidophilum]